MDGLWTYIGSWGRLEEGGRDQGGEAACSFKPSFEDDAYAALMCLRLYTRAVPLCLLFVHSVCVLCVCTHFVCVFEFACSRVHGGILVYVHWFVYCKQALTERTGDRVPGCKANAFLSGPEDCQTLRPKTLVFVCSWRCVHVKLVISHVGLRMCICILHVLWTADW